MYIKKEWYEKYNFLRWEGVSALTLLFFCFTGVASAATLSISPSSDSFQIGDSFTVSVSVGTPTDAINAVSGTVAFPPDLLRVVSVSKGGSILSLWVQDPTYSNTDGTVTFEGIVPNPGFTGASGKILSVTFRVKSAGTARLAITDGQVLANDGSGTNILRNSLGSLFGLSVASTPEAPKPSQAVPALVPALVPTVQDAIAHITSSTHPDETKWYSISHAVFEWTNTQDISAVRIGYDKNADGLPGVLYATPLTRKELDLTDGIWYFHVQEKGARGWGPLSSYRVQIDTVSPAPLTILFPNGDTTAEETLSARFGTTDELSGIDHYTLSIDGENSIVPAEKGTESYALPPAGFGTHDLLITVSDKAGNMAQAKSSFTIKRAPKVSSTLFAWGWLAINYLSVIVVLLGVLAFIILVGVFFWRRIEYFRRHLERMLSHTVHDVERDFTRLETEVLAQLEMLERAGSKRPLTKEESAILDTFKKHLSKAETDIVSDIKKIEDELE